MTALLNRGGTDFNLACDGCGQLVMSLAPTMRNWAVAWGLFSQDGWRGTDLPTGPHACGRCELPPSAPGMVEQSLQRASVSPAGRGSRRIRVQELPDVTVVVLGGDTTMADNAELHDLVAAAGRSGRHLIFDLTQVQRLDSGTVAVLAHARRRAAPDGGHVALTGAAPAVAATLRLLCIDQLFPAFADLPAALLWLRRTDAVSARRGA